MITNYRAIIIQYNYNSYSNIDMSVQPLNVKSISCTAFKCTRDQELHRNDYITNFEHI